jgi:ATP-dependent DNA helicase RecG
MVPNISLNAAVRYLHEAPFDADVQALRDGVHPAQQRLALEELTAHQVSMLQRKHQYKQQPGAPMGDHHGLADQLIANLPFALTGAQQRVMVDIAADLSRHQPMHRLIQGDVGSGKTIVAALSALYAIANGYQVAIMAPTEILAEQHLEAFSEWLEPLGIHIGWLTGSSRVKHRREVLAGLANHQVQLLIGTHALFQEGVEFAQLGLVIIDEQHRFGVHQRLALREKGRDIQPHQLIMTATPIPRTLAMSAYADLDVSIIDELPAGRKPINTVLIDNRRRDQVVERVASACSAGKQAYWVCTLIEESEALQCQAAEDCASDLQNQLPQLRIGLVHGRMKPDEKSIVMDAFKRGEIDLLVATTVIEVGVNVPNAYLMIIENSERLGLAQLHQLRGRVGRGSEASHCVLMYQDPLSMNGKHRLKIMRETTNGFVIAEEDLKLRGPGEVMGTRQTGVAQFRVADLTRDGHLFDEARRLAEEVMSHQPAAAQALVERWLAGADRYADA